MKIAIKTTLLAAYFIIFLSAQSQTIKGFGDSITEGYGTTNSSKTFLNLVSAEKYLTPINYAVGGSRMFNDCFEPTSFECLTAFTQKRNLSTAESTRDYVTIFFGTNDPQHIIDSLSAAPIKWQAHLENYIQQSFIDNGYSKDKIILITLPYNQARDAVYPTLNTRFNNVSQMIRQAASNLNIKLADLWQATLSRADNADLTPDYLHLNDAGHRLLADIVNAQIGTLPVTFSSFDVSCNKINWTTANETDVKKFEVQKSLDGSTWQKISEIHPSISHNYSINIDNEQAAYFRIVQIDNNGRRNYSKIEKSNCSENASYKFNSATNIIKTTKPSNIDVYTMGGALLKSKQKATEMNIADLPAGLYLIRLNLQYFKISKL